MKLLAAAILAGAAASVNLGSGFMNNCRNKWFKEECSGLMKRDTCPDEWTGAYGYIYYDYKTIEKPVFVSGE